MPLNRATLAHLIERAAELASTRGTSVIASFVERLGSVDPLAALAGIVEKARLDETIRSHLAAGRMYWSNPRNAFALAGAGAVATLSPVGDQRFTSVNEEWAALRSTALVEGVSGQPAGVGPVLMGGFAFTADSRESETWTGFPDAHLIVPRLAIAAVDGECFLTTSALVTPDAECDIDYDELIFLRDTAMTAHAGADSEFHESGRSGTLEFSEPTSRAEWTNMVQRAIDDIHAGRFTKVVLARSTQASSPRELDAFALLEYLRAEHRRSFVFGYWRGDKAFVGATPERLVKVEGSNVETSSIAGTIRRGSNPDDDAANARALIESSKDRAEHEAVRLALYDGLAADCDEVTAPAEPSILTLPHVHHLHTEVRARLREGRSLIDLVARLHPTPAVGGSPRNAALRFIDENEWLDRGWYAAPIGWTDGDNGEFAVALRSAVIAGAEATLFAGCGIVGDSVPSLEYDESSLKLRLMESALAAAAAHSSPPATALEQIA